MSKAFEFQTLLSRAVEMDLEKFTAMLEVPVLYAEQFLAAADSQRVATLKGDTGERRRVDLFYPLVKRPGSNVFASMITLGRASNNDIVIEGEGISKFHAYFIESGDEWLLVDAGSSFGTFVDHKKLEPRTERAQLSDKISLRFGNALVGRFLLPKSCHELLLTASSGGLPSF